MKKGIVAIVVLFFAVRTYSQNECKCKESLGLLIKKVESEYPGFNEKTTDKFIYNNFKGRLINKSENCEEADCYDLLKNYLSYFRDHHIDLYYLINKETPNPDITLLRDPRFGLYYSNQPQNPATETKPKADIAEINKSEGIRFTKLSDKTALLCISSFEDKYVDQIEKLLLDNKDELENSEYLIIDIRNNPGGTYDAYDELLPYILTSNTRQVACEYLVTPTLINVVGYWFDDEEGKGEAQRWISMFEGNIGKYINTDTLDVRLSKIKINENSPKQVAVLVNDKTASSGEAFVLQVKQSKKVKILGIPTYGVVDYGSSGLFNFGCSNYKLRMPMWRSMRLPDYPIDNIGVQPDVYLDKSVKDWVKFTVDYLEN